jgi:hypothetical protein
MADESVMDYNEDELTYDERMYQEYLKAKEEGFQGTKEEYLELRDYL